MIIKTSKQFDRVKKESFQTYLGSQNNEDGKLYDRLSREVMNKVAEQKKEL